MTPLPLDFLEISDTTAIICFIVVQSIYTFIFTPVSVYYAYRLWKLRNNNISFITKRRPITVIFGVFLYNFFTVIARPLADLSLLYTPDLYHIRALLIYIIYLILFALLFRLWLLFYDYTASSQILSMKWKTHLLRTHNYIPWTLKYKWMGNTAMIFIIMISCWILTTIILQIGAVINRNITQYLSIAILLPIIFSLVAVAVKIRECRENFCLKKEFTLVGIFAVIGVSVWIIFVVPFLKSGWNIRFIVTNVITASFCYSCSLLSTYWVLKQYYKESMKRRASIKSNTKLSLQQILSTKKGFKLFADFQVKEMCIEHLFFLFEIMHVKSHLMTTKVLIGDDIGMYIPMNFIKVNRKQSMVFDVDEIDTKLTNIIREYIVATGSNAINISSRTRHCLMEILETNIETDVDKPNNTNKRILSVQFIIECVRKFEKAIVEVVKLLKNDSLWRFYYSDEYVQIVQSSLQ
eukprot:317069_1